jgi:hypothetical protein
MTRLPLSTRVFNRSMRLATASMRNPWSLNWRLKASPIPDDAPVTTASGDAMRTAFLVEGNPPLRSSTTEIDVPSAEMHVDHVGHAAVAVRCRRYYAAPECGAP